MSIIGIQHKSITGDSITFLCFLRDIFSELSLLTGQTAGKVGSSTRK